MISRLMVTCLLAAATLAAAEPVLSPDAPKDRPVRGQDTARFERAIAPHIARAKASYPAARQRFLAGLPAGQSFFLTTRLVDAKGRQESVFVAIERLQGGQASGRIWNDIQMVEGFKRGDRFTFPESALLDWLITHADGSEEGNFVGKFLDTWDGR